MAKIRAPKVIYYVDDEYQTTWFSLSDAMNDARVGTPIIRYVREVVPKRSPRRPKSRKT